MVTKQEIRCQIEHLVEEPNESFLELVDRFGEAELCNRKNFVGHITASGTIVHLETKEVLLLHHKFLDAWHVPGGHVDPDDESTVAAALREVEEESGIKLSQLTPINLIDGVQYCVEVNSHPIPHNENKSEDAHYHHDFRYVFGYSGDKNIKIDSNESLNYKWVSIDDRYLAKLFDVGYFKELLYKHQNWQLSDDEIAEIDCNTFTSIAHIEDMARFDIVKTKDKSGVRERNDRRIFSKNEGRYIYFYSECDQFKPNDNEWGSAMKIALKSDRSVLNHDCEPRVSRSYVSIEEYVDISELKCGNYTFTLENGFCELYSFEFSLIDAPKSYSDYATFNGVQLCGLYNDGSIREAIMDYDQQLRIEHCDLKRLFLKFSFSDIHSVDMFQCMIAIYVDSEPFDLISEIDESVTYNGSRNGRLTYAKTLDDFPVSKRENSTLELRIFGENVASIDFKIE